MSSYHEPGSAFRHIPFDDRYYDLESNESNFLKSCIGIRDDGALKRHLMDIGAKAYNVHAYPCIRRFRFAKASISRHFAYITSLGMWKEREDAIFLDVGCCCGTDSRRIVADGWRPEQIIAFDMTAEFWQLGFELFKDSPDRFPAHFISGDVLDPSQIAVVPPFSNVLLSSHGPCPDLNTLTTLNPLRGHVSVIYAACIFHLFTEDQQTCLAEALACLLSPTPGSVIFGEHGGRPVKGLRYEPVDGKSMFCHSPESWVELWNGTVFPKGEVKVEAKLREVVRDDFATVAPKLKDVTFYFMDWSVTRI